MSEKDRQESQEIVAMLQGMKQEDRLMAKVQEAEAQKETAPASDRDGK